MAKEIKFNVEARDLLKKSVPRTLLKMVFPWQKRSNSLTRMQTSGHKW